MVFVKVRETYDLHTVRNKMSVIGIHTPDAKIIKANFPGLLMQCKAYRPYSCDVRVACASVLPVDPLGVGLAEGDVSPEDLFNPILYKACSNFGMSQIEARIQNLIKSVGSADADIRGPSSTVDVDSLTNLEDEFQVYYGLLSNAHEWKHANPQSGLEMRNLKPLVYEILYSFGDNTVQLSTGTDYGMSAPAADASRVTQFPDVFRGNSKPMPMINTTSYSSSGALSGFANVSTGTSDTYPLNHEMDVPAPKILVGCIIVPPSRLHELFYRMVVEWTLEFSMIRPISEITDWTGLERMAGITHYINYDYSETKKALTGDSSTALESDTSLASANVEIKKVM